MLLGQKNSPPLSCKLAGVGRAGQGGGAGMQVFFLGDSEQAI